MVVTHVPRLRVAYADMPAHALLRAEAARFHDVALRDIAVAHRCPRCGSDEHGRPSLLPAPGLGAPAYVSLARAGSLSVVAVTDAGPVGVDVERAGAAESAGVEAVLLHPVERHPDRGDLTRLWVRKEALLKAHGLGLAIDHAIVRVDDEGHVAWGADALPTEQVWLRELAMADHAVAIVIVPAAGRQMGALDVSVGPGRP